MSVVLAPPTRIDAFEVRALLDRAVHTATFRADHPTHGAVVLLQFVPRTDEATGSPGVAPADRARANAQALDAFGRTARDLCTVRHPALAVSLLYLEKGATAFLVTRFVPGETLGSTLGRPQPLAALEGSLGPVFAALRHLHEGGRFHGNVTPDTIVLQGRDAAVLVGFGALERLGMETARRDVESGLAAHRPDLGFPKVARDYAPPETWRGDPPDAAADIYAAGAVLYRALTGSAPVDALLRARAVAGGQPDPYVPVATAAPEPLVPGAAAAIDRALAMARGDRIGSIEALVAGLAWETAHDPFEANWAWLRSWLKPPRRFAALPGARFLPVAALGAGLLTASFTPAMLGLTGLIGWRVDPPEVVFEGPAGGPFEPENATVTLIRAGYVERVERWLYPDRKSLGVLDRPAWLSATTEQPFFETLRISLKTAAQALPAGEHAVAIGATFPWASSMRTAARVLLRVRPAPVAEQPEVPEVPARRQASPETRTSPDADLVCDERAGLRFDQDRPAARPFVDDTGALNLDDLGDAITRCTAAVRRRGANRRFAVQLGRLLAERAVRRGRAGEGRAAEADMTQAIAQWREADRRGSAYAANLVGTYYSGTYNRSGKQDFVAVDATEAAEAWRRSMERGNVVGQRNYAAQLLGGNGVAQDVRTAVTLLQDAARKGDDRAAGILGVAYYTGYPAGVGKDQAQGWQLLRRAPCDAGDARALIRNEIGRNRQSAAGMPSC